MSEEELEKRVIDAVNRARGVWFISMLAAMLFTALTMPLSSLLWFIPIGFLSYIFTMRMAAVVIAARLTEEEIGKLNEANVRHDELKENPASIQATTIPGATIKAATVDEIGPIIGTYMDKPIHEFIMVKAPDEKAASKFTYFGPARVVAGVPEIPVFDDMLVTCAGGILYSKVLA